jgi:ssDNA-binding Zn-finger/Zn-ribbon topoisomerase 1
MPELVVPFAIDEAGRLCRPATAERGKSYRCPACREPIVFRQGKIKVPHFAHKVSDACNQETIVHKTAKLLIQTVVQEWKSGKSNSPAVQRACEICGTSVSQPLPEKVDGAVLEYRLGDGSVADIALMVGDMAQAAVEVRVTHAVGEVKANRLPIPFIEVDGYDIIENATAWKPTIDNFRPLTCERCKSAYSRFRARAKRVAKANNLELPTEYYRHGLHKCWKCKHEIIVFGWPKDAMHDNSAPKTEPLPRTVQYRYSGTAGFKYWANTCPHCRSIQGDFFLYAEPDGPFFSVHFGADSPTAFGKDMMKIASHAAQIGFL